MSPLFNVLARIVEKSLESITVVRSKARPDHQEVRWNQNIDEVELQNGDSSHRSTIVSNVVRVARSSTVKSLRSQRNPAGFRSRHSNTLRH